MPPQDLGHCPTDLGVARLFITVPPTMQHPSATSPTARYSLVAMGLHWLGQPLADVPDSHRAALAGCQWPDLQAVTP